MPIYGYTCDSCQHAFDVLQKMSDPRLVDCPECSEPSLRKQMSAPKFRLKGKGWYETDFKTGDQRNIAGESDKKSTGDSDKVDGADKPVKTAETKTGETKTPEVKKTEEKKTETKTTEPAKTAVNGKAKSA